MMWYGRPNSCGLWLLEDKTLKCGMEGENDRLPSTRSSFIEAVNIFIKLFLVFNFIFVCFSFNS